MAKPRSISFGARDSNGWSPLEFCTRSPTGRYASGVYVYTHSKVRGTTVDDLNPSEVRRLHEWLGRVVASHDAAREEKP